MCCCYPTNINCCCKCIKNDDGSKIYKLKNATCSVTNEYSDFFSLGSGFFIKKNEKYYVITCAHLFEDSPLKIYIDVQNVNNIQGQHRQIQCTLIGVDKAGDVAILRPLTIAESPDDGYDLINHPYLHFGDSTSTKIGEHCYIIGNVLGIDPFSIADGVVRDNKFVLDLAVESMLISAPAWSGNSGSPILNNYGKVIGMVCYSYRNENEDSSTLVGGGTQFMIEEISKQILQNNNNYITKGYMGIIKFVTITEIVLILLRQLYPSFLSGNKDILTGIVVTTIDSPATDATIPLEKNDIITKIKDPITQKEFYVGNLDDQFHPSRMTWFKKAGDQIELTVTRPSTNTSFVTTVTLVTYPPAYDMTFSGSLSENNNDNDTNNNKITTKKISGKKIKITTLATYIKQNDLSNS